MAKADATFLFVGTYASQADARADYAVLKSLRKEGVVGKYDAAVVTKDDEGKVHVDKTSTRKGGWGGAAIGAVVGVIFPPSILVGAAAGGAIGAVSSHFANGLSGTDVKELGDLIDNGEAALLIVGESTLEEALAKAELKAEKRVAKQLDVSTSDLDAALKDATGEVS